MTARPHEKNESAAEEKRKLLKLLDDLQTIDSPPGEIQKRDPFEFPDRHGL